MYTLLHDWIKFGGLMEIYCVFYSIGSACVLLVLAYEPNRRWIHNRKALNSIKTQEPEFSQTCGFRRILEGHKFFHFM